MPRVIFKCPYLKGGSERTTSHLQNYVRYIATREGAQRIVPWYEQFPATEKQREMVAQLLREFPLSRGLFEYEDYQTAPTRGNASEFITRALEDNYDQIAKRDNYVSYIASRPRAQRTGAHALFTGSDDPLVLSNIADEVAHHPGNVWLPIISLRREDAAKLGYDDVERWKELLTGYAMEMAEAMKIPWEQFRWYAAFHDQGHHPHVHMVCYSADGRSGFLTREGIAQIKSDLAQRIFRQELYELYERQTQRRDELTQEPERSWINWSSRCGRARWRIRRSNSSWSICREAEEPLRQKAVCYLKAPLKSVVDEIVDELAKDERVARAYELWYELREEVLRTYKEDLPPRLPLSRQKEFKRIRNMVIEEALRLGYEDVVFDPTALDEPPYKRDVAETDLAGEAPQESEPSKEMEEHTEPEGARKYRDRPENQYARYRLAKIMLADPAAEPEQFRTTLEWLTEAADAGRVHAQYELGKIYRDGRGVEKDALLAAAWLTRAAEQGSDTASYALGVLLLTGGEGLAKDIPSALNWLRRSAEDGNQYAQYRLGRLLLRGEDVPREIEEAVRWLTTSAEQGNQYAQYALGKLYLMGKEVPRDPEAAVRWFALSAAQGNEYAQYFLDHMDEGLSILSCATRLLHHLSGIFQEQASRGPIRTVTFTDRKLRQRIREKKMAMGHKPDDHEDAEISMR